MKQSESYMQNYENFKHVSESRPWGYFTVIAEGGDFLIKIIHVNPGQKLSLQSHNYRSEHWTVVKGIAKVILDKNEYTLKTGESIDIAIKSKHSLQNPFKEDLEIVEIQRGNPLSEEDIIRYEDMYGRV